MRIPGGRFRPTRRHRPGRRSLRVPLPLVLLCLFAAAGIAAPGLGAGEAEGPPYLGDRGDAIPTSLFGTYVRQGEFLVYPFYEYTRIGDAEYNPDELGFNTNRDFFGEETEQEALIFIGYGFTDRFAIEFEAALWASAELTKAPNDPSNMPDRIEETGLGDVESQLRWIWSKETATRPMYYSFWEIVFPLQKNKIILGTQDWETALGFGAVRGFRWGTLNGRVTAKYDREDGQAEPGEFAIEYLKRTSPRWRWVATFEGEDDELSLIGEAQLTLAEWAVLKLNLGLGVSRKAPDYAPEVGVIFSF
jgi:hypothetical protein